MGRDRRNQPPLLKNLYDYTVPESGESFTKLLDTAKAKIVRIVSSDTPPDTLYVQEEDEWVVLLEGEATLEIEGKAKVLQRGDMLFIPAQTPHRVLSTRHGTLWLAVHLY